MIAELQVPMEAKFQSFRGSYFRNGLAGLATQGTAKCNMRLWRFPYRWHGICIKGLKHIMYVILALSQCDFEPCVWSVGLWDSS